MKSLAPGFIPLFAYIAADLIFGETVGLFVGIGIGVIEFVVSLIKEKKVDLFIVADTALLAAMGALSLLSHNQLFFRLKPAIVEAVLAVSMAVLLVLPPDALKGYMNHQLKGFAIEDSGMPAVQKSLGIMLAVLLLHAALTVWAALSASAAVWGFVSGGLLYLLLGGSIFLQWLLARRKNRAHAPAPGPGKSMDPGARASAGEALGMGAEPGAGGGTKWCLLIWDGSGRIYATKTMVPGEGRAVWDSPVRGSAVTESDLERQLSSKLKTLGIDVASVQAATGSPFTIQPAFILQASDQGDREVVLVTVLQPSAFPRGNDPTERRFWQVSDLVSLEASGKISAAFERELKGLSAFRHSLRESSDESIVSSTNDAAI